jgi:hypothetical protein
MMQSPAISWFLKCALMAATVLLADRLAAVAIGTKLQQPAVTTRDGTLITLNRYLQEPTPDVVLVGSSVTFRLMEEYFSRIRVRNLALAGGSPETGLAIVTKQKQLPKIVAIETNVLSRPVDRALVERFTGKEHSDLFLRPVRMAVAAYEKWNHAPPDPARRRAAQDDLLKQPPSGFDNRAYLEIAVQQMNADDLEAGTRASVARIKPLIAEIERRGVQVLLVTIPFAPEIEQTRTDRMTNEIVREAFPDRNAWLSIDVPPGELRWHDGVHLDERSAIIVARAIEQALVARGRK